MLHPKETTASRKRVLPAFNRVPADITWTARWFARIPSRQCMAILSFCWIDILLRSNLPGF